MEVGGSFLSAKKTSFWNYNLFIFMAGQNATQMGLTRLPNSTYLATYVSTKP